MTGTFDIATLNISALTDSAADLTTLDGYIRGADAAIKEMTDRGQQPRCRQVAHRLQQDFV